jgi:iron(III) transport system substrate-binding protein
MGKAFEKAYPGIKVNTLRITSTEQATRYSAEKSANSETADFLLNSEPSFLEDATKKGLLTSYKKAGFLPDGYPTKWVAPGLGDPYHIELLALCYNSDKVSAAEAPTSWSDLLDPKWKGKITSSSPKIFSAMMDTYATVADHVGGDFLNGMRSQKVSYNEGGNVTTSEDLAAGQYAIQFACNPSVTKGYQAKGAPIKMSFPKDVTGPPFIYALNPKPASPNVQKLFAEWFISEDGSKTLADLGSGVVNSATAPQGITYQLPEFKYFAPDESKSVLEKLGF